MKLRTLLLSLLSCASLSAQGTWTWMSGDSTVSPPAVFGTQGVPDPANLPPALINAASFTDAQGNFGVFGGSDYLSGTYATVWKFDTASLEWTWMKGPPVAGTGGVCGTQGVPDTANTPGARHTMASWTDLQGNLWIFGGSGLDPFGGSGTLADLWKYDPTANEWTWMNGPAWASYVSCYTGHFGAYQQPDSTSQPPARFRASATWIDSNGDLWLYGGENHLGLLNDLWRYSIATNRWTWMHGSGAADAPPVYGTKNIPSPANSPGGLAWATPFNDATGNLWALCGSLNGDFLTAVWKFDPQTREWTWMTGTNDGTFSTTGAPCTPGTLTPSGRWDCTAHWTDACGRFWFFGGFNSTYRNDLWMFDPVLLEFILAGSYPVADHFGTRFVPAPQNHPATGSGQVSFTDGQGSLWLFGGFIPSGSTNALWKYTIAAPCPASVAAPVALPFHDSVFCAEQSVSFNAGTAWPGFTYHWNFGDPSTNADTSNACSAVYSYTATGTYTVTLLVSSGQGCYAGADTGTAVITISGPAFHVDLGSDTTICGPLNVQLDAGNAATWEWSTGAATQTITVGYPGTYSVNAVSSAGCAASDTVIIAQTAAYIGPDSTDCSALFLDAGECPGCTFVWSTGDTTQYTLAVTSGIYFVTVTAPDSTCSTTDTMSFTLLSPPVVTFSAPASVVCITDTAFLLTGGWPWGGVYIAPGYVTNNLFDPAGGPGTVIVFYNYTNAAGCVDFAADTITVDACTGIAANDNNGQLNIFPNPANEEVTIRFSPAGNDETQLRIENAAGQLIYETKRTGGFEEKLATEQLADGVYFLRVINGEQVMTRKIVVQHVE